MSCLWLGSTSIAARGSNRPTSAGRRPGTLDARPSAGPNQPASSGHGRRGGRRGPAPSVIGAIAPSRRRVRRSESPSDARPASGPPSALELGQPTRRGRRCRSRIRAATAGRVRGHDPDPHRHVAAGQAGRVAPAAGGEGRGASGQSASGRAGASVAGDASTSAAATSQRQVADRRRRPGRGRVAVIRTGRAPTARASASTRLDGGRVAARDDDPRSIDEQVRRRRPRSPLAPSRPSDDRRRRAGRGPSPGATSATLVLATSVTTASGAEGGRATVAGEVVEQRQAGRRRRRPGRRGRRRRRRPRHRSAAIVDARPSAQRASRPRTGRAPGAQHDQASGPQRPRGPRRSARAIEPPIRPKPEECDAHAREYRSAGARRAAGTRRCTIGVGPGAVLPSGRRSGRRERPDAHRWTPGPAMVSLAALDRRPACSSSTITSC